MVKNKTTETNKSVIDFIDTIADETKRIDSFKLIDWLNIITGFDAKMWGPSIIGFGTYHYKYASGHEGDSPLISFSPRAAALTLYLTDCFEKREELLKKLGKHKAGKGCIYVKKLEDINSEVLLLMISYHLQQVKNLYSLT